MVKLEVNGRTYLDFLLKVELKLSFAVAKIDLDSVFETAHRKGGVQVLDVQHSIWEIHLVDFSAVEREEYFLGSEDEAYSNGRAFFLKIDV